MSACHAEDRGFESRRFRFDYLCIIQVIIEHVFLSLQRSPRGLKRKGAHPELDEPFDACDDLARRGC